MDSVESTSSKSNPLLYVALGLLIGLVVGAGGAWAFKGTSQTTPNSTTTTTTSVTRTIPQITDAVAATTIDAQGKAVSPKSVFSAKNDKTIYVVGTLKDVPKGTKIEYVRYLNGRYLDSKIATITKDGLSYFSFNWTSKTAQSAHPVGTYMVKLYLNGATKEAITYRVE